MPSPSATSPALLVLSTPPTPIFIWFILKTDASPFLRMTFENCTADPNPLALRKQCFQPHPEGPANCAANRTPRALRKLCCRPNPVGPATNGLRTHPTPLSPRQMCCKPDFACTARAVLPTQPHPVGPAKLVLPTTPPRLPCGNCSVNTTPLVLRNLCPNLFTRPALRELHCRPHPAGPANVVYAPLALRKLCCQHHPTGRA